MLQFICTAMDRYNFQPFQCVVVVLIIKFNQYYAQGRTTQNLYGIQLMSPTPPPPTPQITYRYYTSRMLFIHDRDCEKSRKTNFRAATHTYSHRYNRQSDAFLKNNFHTINYKINNIYHTFSRSEN